MKNRSKPELDLRNHWKPRDFYVEMQSIYRKSNILDSKISFLQTRYCTQKFWTKSGFENRFGKEYTFHFPFTGETCKIGTVFNRMYNCKGTIANHI